MTKFTKERLEEIAELARKAAYKPCAMHMTNLLAACDSEVIDGMARQLLDIMEQEPVAYMQIDGDEIEYNGHNEFSGGGKGVPLYAAPLLPQPAVPDEIDVNDPALDTHRKWMAEGWNLCRAAMLQAGNHTDQHLDMVDRSGDANEKADCRLPFDQWLSQQNETIDVDCGCVTTEAFYHWLRVAYEAGNSPVNPDGWIPVSERMPDDDTHAVAADIAHGEIYSAFAAWFIHGRFSVMEGLSASNYDGGAIIEIDTPITHWMPLPAAPQQEVKSALEHGMQRYAGAMQKLSEGDK